MNRTLQPPVPTAQGYVDQGYAAHARGDVAQARRCYELALALDRRHAPAMHLLGVALAQQGDHAQAAQWLRQAARAMPHDFAVHNNLGNAWFKLGRWADALRAYDRALQAAPASHRAQVLNNRGNALQGLGRFAEAIQSYQEALRWAPEHANCMANLAKALVQVGQVAEALAHASRAAELAPNSPAPHVAKGWALLALGQPSEGALAVGQWLVQDDNHAEAQYCRAMCAAALERWDLAYPALQRAHALDPSLPGLRTMLADAAVRQGDLEAAAGWLAQLREQARQGQPELWPALLQAQQMALDWTDYAEARNQTRQLVRQGDAPGLSPFTTLRVWDDGDAQREFAQAYARRMGWTHEAAPPAVRPQTGSQQRLRVAYLSADFRAHPTTQLACPTWEAHDRQRFEWIGVYFGPPKQPGQDPWHDRARAAFDRFEVITGLTDDEALQRLRDLDIDVAVDLMGYTKFARPSLLAWRVAPVQAGYLGYPGTTGMPALDYVIADRWVAPRHAWREFTEQVVWLPTTYQANHRAHEAAPVPTRVALGLPANAVVLSCFNNPDKIQPETFACWMAILAQTPQTVLWLRVEHEGMRVRLREHARAHGIEPDRLVFAPHAPVEQHLARMAVADLFLDTWPYNAHTTAAEALWMGLPVLTREGHAFAGRVAASLLHAVGLPQLIAADESSYVARAVELAQDAQARQQLRQHLLSVRHHSPLFDAQARARELEAAFEMMHARWRQGLPPAAFEVARQ